MKKWKYNLKLFIDNYLILGILVLGYFFLLGSFFQKNSAFSGKNVFDIWMYKSNLIPYTYFHFFLLNLISVLYFGVEDRGNCKELLQRKVYFKINIERIMILMLINGIVFFVFTTISIFFCIKNGKNTFLFSHMKQMILSFLGYHFAFLFLSGVISIFLAYFISLVRKKYLQSVLFIIIQSFFGFPMFWIEKNLLLGEINGKYLNMFLDLFAILPGEYNISTDLYSINPVQIHRWILLLLWILLLSLGYQLYNMDLLKRIFKNLIPFECIMIMLLIIMFLVPYSSISGNYRANSRYTNLNYEMDQINIGRINKEADFGVENYDIDIYAYLNLLFRVNMKLTRTDLESFSFTLMDCFNIYEIKDQDGNKLNYDRNSHYLTIYPSSEIREIYISYGGACQPFYGDITGICLRSGTAFFPVSGWVPIYEDSNYYNIRFLNDIHVPEETEFNLKVHTWGEAYSSLPNNGYNAFCGNADSFFVLKGYYDTLEIDGATIVFPPFSEYSKNILDKETVRVCLESIENRIGKDRYNSVKRCIFIDWVFPGSRPIDLYTNYIVIPYIDSKMYNQDSFEQYMEIEGLKNDTGK